MLQEGFSQPAKEKISKSASQQMREYSEYSEYSEYDEYKGFYVASVVKGA